jgi:transposase
LHEVEGYEHQEIAEMLGCSVGNSKSQLHKAKLRIRELLAQAPQARSVKVHTERSRTKTAIPRFEDWERAIGPSVAMHAVSNMPQLAGPTV